MSTLVSRDVSYRSGGAHMIGRLVLPASRAASEALPAVLIAHDASGRSQAMIQAAERVAAAGFIAFAIDLWGDAYVPSTGAEFGALIGAMVRNRPDWEARVDAAAAVLTQQPEVDTDRIGAMGFCFGGSSVLELARRGGVTRGVVSVHGGLDLLHPGWDAARPDVRVLLCTGSLDPMATPAQRDALLAEIDDRGIDCEVDLYSGVQHGFTNPWSDHAGDGFAYHRQAADRAWRASEQFLIDLLEPRPTD